MRLWAFGYDMDNMKARSWIDALLPVTHVHDESRALLVRDTATRLIDGTDVAAGALIGAIERALFQRPKDKSGDRSPFKAQLWSSLDADFYQAIREVADITVAFERANDFCAAFRTHLEHRVLEIFDRGVDVFDLLPATVRRVVGARFDLAMTMRGYSKTGAKLFGALRLPVPSAAGGAASGNEPTPRSRKRTRTEKTHG